jgi:aspartate aminotransferase-like enzyme
MEAPVPKYRLMAPGPVAVPERVRLAMAGTLLHHRAPAFLPVLEEVRRDVKRVFQTEREVLLLACSGTGAMEAAVANCLAQGERAVVVRGGKFGERWADLCTEYGVGVIPVDVEWGRPVDPEAVRAVFARNPDARALLVQASETSTGVYHPIEALARVVREAPERLMIVDGISGVGVHDLPMDRWGLDVVISGSQKSWLLPPGLAFIALSERAQRAITQVQRGRYYLDLRKELRSQPKNQTAFTPVVSLILGLREALTMILEEEGLERVFARHECYSRATRAGAQAIGLRLFASDSPSFACTSLWVPEGLDGKALIRRIRDAYGITVEGGRDAYEGRIVRIGHLGDLDEFDVLTAIAALEMALRDLGFPVKLGEGVRACMEILHERLGTRG